uniref:Uncharacterized protein n=1 Tax=Mucochytrium quahogii TaxID=96639 RepID=A0A7S2RQE3_9STRA|mmetsp:Transcript_1719/g.2594  ORF Transcript_1719/g.2594 Transcript_1719/m.2594 type:complete len:965 (+) Transcript_1719:151-3045(+)
MMGAGIWWILCWLLCSLGPAVGDDAALAVSHPSVYAVWYEGQDVVIQWDSNTQKVRNHVELKIEIVKANAGKRDGFSVLVADRVGMQGRLKWKVPVNCLRDMGRFPCFEDGKRYLLRFTYLNTAKKLNDEHIHVGSSLLFPTGQNHNGFLIRPRRLLVFEPTPLSPALTHKGLYLSFDAGGTIYLSWRTEFVPVDHNVSVYLHSPFKTVPRTKLLADAAGSGGSVAVALPKDLPTGDGYKLVFETSSLDAISTTKREFSGISLGSRLVAGTQEFRVIGPQVRFLKPDPFNNNFALGENIKVQWVVPNVDMENTNFPLSFRLVSCDRRNQIEVFMFDSNGMQGTEQLVDWQIPAKEDLFPSRCWRIEARFRGFRAGLSSKLFISGYSAVLLSPFPETLSSITSQHNTSAPVFMGTLPIRWIWHDASGEIRYASVFLRGQSDDHRVWLPIMENISLAKYPNNEVFIDWKFPRKTVLPLHGVALQVVVIPHIKSIHRPGKRTHLWALSCPFFLIVDTHSAGVKTYVHRALTFRRDSLKLEFGKNEQSISLQRRWAVGREVRLPNAIRESSMGKSYLLYYAKLSFNSTHGTTIFHVKAKAGEKWVVPADIEPSSFGLLMCVDKLDQTRVLGVSPPVWITFGNAIKIEEFTRSYNPGEAVKIYWLYHRLHKTPGQTKIALGVIGDPSAGEQNIGEISKSNSQRGILHWVIPCSVVGGKYDIYEKGKGSLSLATITVVPVTSLVTSPIYMDVWGLGSIVKVSWIYRENDKCVRDKGPSRDKLDIVLFWGKARDSEQFVLFDELHEKYSQEGSHSVTIRLPSTSLSEGSDYRVRIRLGGGVIILSEPFNIYQAPREQYVTNDPLHKQIDIPVLMGDVDDTGPDNSASGSSSPVSQSALEVVTAKSHRFIISLGIILLVTSACILTVTYRREIAFIFSSRSKLYQPQQQPRASGTRKNQVKKTQHLKRRKVN